MSGSGSFSAYLSDLSNLRVGVGNRKVGGGGGWRWGRRVEIWHRHPVSVCTCLCLSCCVRNTRFDGMCRLCQVKGATERERGRGFHIFRFNLSNKPVLAKLPMNNFIKILRIIDRPCTDANKPSVEFLREREREREGERERAPCFVQRVYMQVLCTWECLPAGVWYIFAHCMFFCKL